MSINTSGCLSHQIFVENPEELTTKNIQSHQQQLRCRICYQTSKPLVSICGCTGSIQYVHEQCILDWIAKKLQVSDVLDIPRCEICNEKFSARMKIGKKKLCLSLLWQKIKSMKQKEVFQALFHLTMLFFCILTLLSFSLDQVYSTQGLKSSSLSKNNDMNNPVKSQQKNMAKQIITDFFCPLYGILYFINCAKSKKRWFQQSMVQVVQVVLQPKLVRKY